MMFADPIGFKFDTGNDSVGYCTDTGILTQQAQKHLYNARILALEANHDQDMLKRGPYPSFLKARVAGSSGHLSNNQASEALSILVGESTQTIVAMHLSQENNRPGPGSTSACSNPLMPSQMTNFSIEHTP